MLTRGVYIAGHSNETQVLGNELTLLFHIGSEDQMNPVTTSVASILLRQYRVLYWAYVWIWKYPSCGAYHMQLHPIHGLLLAIVYILIVGLTIDSLPTDSCNVIPQVHCEESSQGTREGK